MELKSKDVEILRELAKQYMEIASLPVQREKMELWKAFNRGDRVRPMVLIDQIPWYELNQNGELTGQVEHPMLRNLEAHMRQRIYQWKHFPVDMVVEPLLTIPYAASNNGYDFPMIVETLSLDSNNPVVSQSYQNQLREEEDIAKIHDMKITFDPVLSAEYLEQARYVFDGIVPVRQAGGANFYLALWDILSFHMGVNDIYYDLVDRPEFIHKIMRRITDATLAGIHQLNELGIVDTSENICHCSVTYNDELLPDFGAGTAPVTQNVWNCGMAQLFTAVSPEITEEFEVPYISELARHYGMLYYGCCDRLDDRMDIVQKLPNLKKLSCSPWSNREAFAEKLRKDVIMSNKPTPAYLAGSAAMDRDVVVGDLQRTCRAAKANNVNLEFILKDISTIDYQPQRLTQWADWAMEVAQNA